MKRNDRTEPGALTTRSRRYSLPGRARRTPALRAGKTAKTGPGRRLATLGLAMLIAAGCSGCGSFFSDSYHWSQPFAYEIGGNTGDALEISNYNMLKSALIDLVSNHEAQGTLRFSRYNGSPVDDLAAACLEIRTTNPLGAYAVSSLTYDTSRIISYYLADVQITYSRSVREIQSIVGVSTAAELQRRLNEAVTAYSGGVVLRVYSALVNELVISDLVQELYLSDPVSVVCEPAVSVTSYPSEGINRIYDVRLTYPEAPETLLSQSDALSREVRRMSAEVREAVPEGTPALLSLEAGQRLYRRSAGGEAAADGGSAYDALVNASAGSKGIALAYKALCSALELDCMVVDGNIGDMGAERHYWNIICLDGDWYHVDVSRFGGELAQAFLLDDAGLWGIYLWNTERYPECAGPLRAADVLGGEDIPLPPAEEELETAPPEEQPEDLPGEGTSPAPQPEEPAAEAGEPETNGEP